jgi:nitrogen PTS system EIIA component
MPDRQRFERVPVSLQKSHEKTKANPSPKRLGTAKFAFMEDLDAQQLAAYLHLTPAQVTKMASRGRLPGRRVGGDWRFSEAEIHHWLEERIGAGDEEELDRLDLVLDRNAMPHPRPVVELCQTATIEIPLSSRTRGSVIRNMCEIATRTGLMWDANAMAQAVEMREAMHPTALDCGVALLHPRRPQTSILSDSVIALGICPSAIPFSDDGQLVDVFFLICSFDDPSHLRILSRLSRLITATDLLTRLRQATDANQAHAALVTCDHGLDSAGEL